LTASENCIERVGKLIMRKNLFDVVLRELKIALNRKKVGKIKVYE
jgi:hypothetical protein